MTFDIQELIKLTGNEYADIVDNGVVAGDVSGYVDTGSYTMNALLSGSIYGGFPKNKIYALAGEPSVGKTFYALNVVRRFLEEHPKGIVFYFESESALSKDMIASRGIDTKRVVLVPVITVQEFRTQILKILNHHIEMREKEKPDMLFVLDSLGNLSTNKEIEDISDGKDTRDMTRAQLLRGTFRSITLKIGLAQIPLIITNHVYDVIGSYVPIKKMNGGSGLEYAASGIVFLSKKKDAKLDNEEGESTGSVVVARLKKGRFTIQDKKVETWIDYRKGLDRYYGLIDLAIKFGVFKKGAKHIELPDGTKVFEKEIKKNPEKYFDKDTLDVIDEFCKGEFLYGTSSFTDVEEGE